MDEDDKPTKEELIYKYRGINVEYEGWWEFIYEDFKEDMKAKGVEVDDMSFQGFYSQGDYATFSATVMDDVLFMIKEKLDTKYPSIFKAAELGAVHITFSALSGYHWRGHQGASIEITDMHYFEFVADEDMNPVYQDMYQDGIDDEFDNFQLEVGDLAKQYAGDLFTVLQENYEWLTDDEQVWDTIVANEMHL